MGALNHETRTKFNHFSHSKNQNFLGWPGTISALEKHSGLVLEVQVILVFFYFTDWKVTTTFQFYLVSKSLNIWNYSCLIHSIFCSYGLCLHIFVWIRTLGDFRLFEFLFLTFCTSMLVQVSRMFTQWPVY